MTCGESGLTGSRASSGVSSLLPTMLPEMKMTATTNAAGIRLRELAEIEHEWLMKGRAPHNRPTLGWMPYQLADFVAIMVDCVQAADGVRFLDVGCGPGTKMAAASLLFGLKTDGIELDTAMAMKAAFVNTEGEVCNGDALYWDDGWYGDYDIIWLYRPFRDATLEKRLEDRIRFEMKPGAILAGGAWEAPCPFSWIPIVDDWDTKRGAWAKP